MKADWRLRSWPPQTGTAGTVHARPAATRAFQPESVFIRSIRVTSKVRARSDSEISANSRCVHRRPASEFRCFPRARPSPVIAGDVLMIAMGSSSPRERFSGFSSLQGRRWVQSASLPWLPRHRRRCGHSPLSGAFAIAATALCAGAGAFAFLGSFSPSCRFAPPDFFPLA